ncbi:Regulator of RNase E activity RraA [Ruania alba]|uniref:Putative 4-hydroxy-4-methyl-2-oxoglutarate aldolase n=2 Tax=Ruania alba TaxID=648782 RepID=A0A1H5MED1_9MICO|nr:Regulator of RNase E activity RraA [Ruania alba]
MNSPAPADRADANDVASLYKYLRVADVADALDGIGYFDITLVSQEIRPLWEGMKFWGPAATIRAVPANKPMWQLETTEEIVRAHGEWFDKYPPVRLPQEELPGHVVVMESGGGREVGFWGSENVMGTIGAGAVGIVTDGYCRDTAEVTLQQNPICVRGRGRTIIPGRIEVVEVQGTIAVGGVQVRPGDIVGCDDDGLIVVPAEVAEEVATHARAVLLADMEARRKHYRAQSRPDDETVDVEAVIAYYADL